MADSPAVVIQPISALERRALLQVLVAHEGHEEHNCQVVVVARLAQRLINERAAEIRAAAAPGGARNPIALSGHELLYDLAEDPATGEYSYLAIGSETRKELRLLAADLIAIERLRATPNLSEEGMGRALAMNRAYAELLEFLDPHLRTESKGDAFAKELAERCSDYAAAWARTVATPAEGGPSHG